MTPEGKRDRARLQAALRSRGEIWIAAEACLPAVVGLAADCRRALATGGQILFCGNGGSASQADHLAAELVGRYATERRALAGRALSDAGATLTAIGNDYGYDAVFARQVEAAARRGDVLIALSTSGRSPNIRRALEAGRKAGCVTALFTGGADPATLPPVDHLIAIPSTDTPAVQELHLFFGHLLCEILEADVGGGSEDA